MPLKHSVEEIILKNGARGLLIDTPEATAVHYDIQFRAGNDYAPSESLSQVAHIMEHMSFGPNERYDSLDEFSRIFSKKGAYHNAWTSDVDMVYTVDAAVMEWQRILDLQLLAISKPRFKSEILESEKGNVREEIIGYKNSNGRILWQTIMRQAGLKRWFDEDELKTIDAVTLKHINDHHKKTHVTNNMRFILVGDLKKHKETIIEMLEGVSLPAGTLLPVKKDTPGPSGLVFIRRKDSPSIIFNLTFFLNRNLTRKELRAMTALNDIVTGSFHSRILGEARTRGICYDMSSGIDDDQTGSVAWSFGGQVSPGNARELFELIGAQIQDISKNSVTERELEDAKEARLGALQMSTETVRSLASWYETQYFEDNNIDYVDLMPGLIEGTSLEEIRLLVKEFLDSDAWAFGGIGNTTQAAFQEHYNSLAKQLSKVK